MRECQICGSSLCTCMLEELVDSAWRNGQPYTSDDEVAYYLEQIEEMQWTTKPSRLG